MSVNESTFEYAALTWFGDLGYAVGYGPQFVPGEPAVQLEDHHDGGDHDHQLHDDYD